MKKIKIQRIIAMGIVALMIAQLLPMNVFALSKRKSHPTRSYIEDNTSIANIAKEVKEERTEYSKTFLLEDGSYCNISTYASIHKKVNGKWESISSATEKTVNSIEDARALLQDVSIAEQKNQLSVNSAKNNEKGASSINSSLIVNSSACSVSNGVITLVKGSALVAKPSEINYYHDQNKLVSHVTVDMECTNNSTGTTTIDLREKTGSWNENTNFSSTSFNNEHVLDSVSCTTSGLYSWDLTDLYAQWDKGVKDNNGFVLAVSSRKSNITVNSLSITVIYRDIDETDASSTYHTVDMSRAGTLYINDLTSTVKLEQDILRIPRTVMPIYLKRIYSLSDTFSSNSSDGFRWNYESEIRLVDGIASWQTFDGTVQRFVQANPAVNNGEYTKWKLVSKNVQENELTTTLWIKSSELNQSTYNYSNFYIVSNYTKYSFDNVGHLIKMEIRSDPDNCIDFIYANDKFMGVNYVEDGITSTITFVYLSNEIRVMFSTDNDISGETTSDIIHIYKTYNLNNDITTIRVTYSDNKYVEYEYNDKYELTKITDENGSTLDLIYFSMAAFGNRLYGYDKNDAVSDIVEAVTIQDEETYVRRFESSINGVEKIEYDKDFRIICHWDYNGNYTFVSYDEDGNVNSYVMPEDNPNVEYENGFNSEDECNELEYENGGSTSFVEYSTFPAGHNILNLENKGDGCLKFNISNSLHSSGYIELNGLRADTTYVFGAWLYVDEANPSGSSNIMVETSDAGEDQYFTFDYDVTKKDCWQYRLMAFKLKEDRNVLISINLVNQSGTFYVDNMVLYEASEAQADAFENISVTPFEIQNNEDGSVNKEIISDGITSLFNEYSYENNQISSVTDMRGITTYYGYDANTGTLNQIGNLIDNNGNIINPTQLITGLNRLPTYIEQNVTNVLTNENVKMVSNFTYDLDEQICSITNNGVTYNYEYTAGKLTGISKNGTEMIDYNYSNDKIGSIQYNNGFIVDYTYENGKVKEVDFKKNNISIRKYVYTYGNDGIIQSVLDTVGNLKIEYTSTGYEFYCLADSTVYPIYTYSENVNGTVTEKYYPDIVSSKNEDLKSKSCITRTTTKDEKYVDAVTGETTISSNQTVNKVLDWSSESNHTDSTYNFSRYSVNDYFGRISDKSTTINSSVSTSKLRISESYSYKDLSATTTSTLISSHNSRIDTISSDNVITNKVSEKRYYEYDQFGNIVFEYHKENGIIDPIAYYEYDEANQLVGEYNVDNQLSVTYTYDNGGNIKSKIYHNISSVSCDSNTHKVVNYGTVSNTVTYSYDVNSKDLLTNFNGTSISYDAYGNPLNYSGERYTTFTADTLNSYTGDYYNKYSVTGTCEWTGKFLSSFETNSNKYLYHYDENGNRISKTVMSKNNGVFEIQQEVLYIWDGELLSGYIYKTYNKDSDGNISIISADVEIVYDQKGEAIGFIFDDEMEWYFVKDCNGSVIKIVDASGNEVTSISYDAWGQANFCFNADISSSLGVAKYLILSVYITANPICYKGYLFDYETGLYFAKDKVYSPAWGRYLNHADFEKKQNSSYSVNSTNMYAFCNNNPINVFDPYSYISNVRAEYFTNSEIASGVDVEMNKAFLSRVFCGLFANSLVKKFGTWEYNTGNTAYGMNAEYIAKNLFAHNVAKYELSALNTVNASWGDGWVYQNSQNSSVKVYKNDINSNKYEMIWNAANNILQTT